MSSSFLKKYDHPGFPDTYADVPPNPNQLRWKAFAIPEQENQVDFVDGIRTICGAGEPSLRHGCVVHIYTCNASMANKVFYSSDGDFLIVPQQGKTSHNKLFNALAQICCAF